MQKRQKRLKNSKLRVRVDDDMRERVQAEAAARGEAESVVVREALTEYFAKRPKPGQIQT